MNSGKYSLGEGRSKRFVQGHEAGTPDVMAFNRINHDKCQRTNMILDLLFVEVKRPKKRATELQEAKMIELAEYGAKCIIATSIEDLKEHGL